MTPATRGAVITLFITSENLRRANAAVAAVSGATRLRSGPGFKAMLDRIASTVFALNHR
jgi:hypothetical protein